MREDPLLPDAPLNYRVHRVPFFLEPDYPEDEDFEETNEERLWRKWGGKEAFERQKQRHRLKERGQEVGIEHFDARRTASSTMRSHRLVQWTARTHGLDMSEDLYDVLNEAHFVQGRKLNDINLLCDCAASVGVPRESVRDFLVSEQGRDEVKQMFEKVQAHGIHSIPTFIVDGQHMLNGAAHANEIERVLRAVERQWAEEPTSLYGRTAFAPQLDFSTSS